METMSKKNISKNCILELFDLTGELEADTSNVGKRVAEYEKDRNVYNQDLIDASGNFIFTLSGLVNQVIDLAQTKYSVIVTRTTIVGALDELLVGGILKKGRLDEVSKLYDFSYDEDSSKESFIYLEKIEIVPNIFSNKHFKSTVEDLENIQASLLALTKDIKTNTIDYKSADQISFISNLRKTIENCLIDCSEKELLMNVTTKGVDRSE